MSATLYIGSSGAHLAAAHLLRLRLNTTPLPVDDGIDLLGHRVSAAGDTRTYLFQVKTTQSPVCNFRFTSGQFERYLDHAVNLVVVLWERTEVPQALVLPPRLLRMMTTGGFQDPRAPLRRDGPLVYLRVEYRAGRIYVRNRAYDFTGMANRFDLVEATDINTHALPEYAVWCHDKAALRLDPDPPPLHNVNTLGGDAG